MIKVRLIGVETMTKNLKTILKRHPDRVAEALYAEAKIELAEAQRRVPVDTGYLKSRGLVTKPVRKGQVVSVQILFDAPYAVVVHEDLEAFHRTGQAKYLESVINESQSSMGARIAKRIRIDKR